MAMVCQKFFYLFLSCSCLSRTIMSYFLTKRKRLLNYATNISIFPIGPIKPSQQDVLKSSTPSPQKVSDEEETMASQWSREDVQNWLKDNELTELCETFKRCRGSHLADMYSSCCEERKVFNDEFKSDYGIENAQTRRDFVVALKDAFKKK